MCEHEEMCPKKKTHTIIYLVYILYTSSTRRILEKMEIHFSREIEITIETHICKLREFVFIQIYNMIHVPHTRYVRSLDCLYMLVYTRNTCRI